MKGASRYIIPFVVVCWFMTVAAFCQDCCEFKLIRNDTTIQQAGIYVIEPKQGFRAKIVFEPIPATIVEQFQTSWTYASNTADPFLNRDCYYSNQVGATLIANLYGRKFEIVTSTAPHHGTIGVTLNSGPEVLVNLYSATRVNDKVVYESPMPFGTNSIKIRVVGNGYGVIDYIRVTQ